MLYMLSVYVGQGTVSKWICPVEDANKSCTVSAESVLKITKKVNPYRRPSHIKMD